MFLLLFAATYFLYFWWLQLIALAGWGVAFVVLARKRTRVAPRPDAR